MIGAIALEYKHKSLGHWLYPRAVPLHGESMLALGQIPNGIGCRCVFFLLLDRCDEYRRDRQTGRTRSKVHGSFNDQRTRGGSDTEMGICFGLEDVLYDSSSVTQ